MDAELTLAEFETALSKQRECASPGGDHILPNMLSLGSEKLRHHIFGILRRAFASEAKLSQLKSVLVKPILKDKQGDIHDPGNFRPIALLSSLLKLYESMLNERLMSFIEGTRDPGDPIPKLNEETNGFRERRWCMDN